jgi:RDD family
MQENNDTIFSEIEAAEMEATLLQRFMTGLIDFAIDILLIFLVYKIIPRGIFVSIAKLNSILIPIIVILLVAVYRFIFLMLFNKTIGMMVFRVKFLNKRFQPYQIKKSYLVYSEPDFLKLSFTKKTNFINNEKGVINNNPDCGFISFGFCF